MKRSRSAKNQKVHCISRQVISVPHPLLFVSLGIQTIDPVQAFFFKGQTQSSGKSQIDSVSALDVHTLGLIFIHITGSTCRHVSYLKIILQYFILFCLVLASCVTFTPFYPSVLFSSFRCEMNVSVGIRALLYVHKHKEETYFKCMVF